MQKKIIILEAENQFLIRTVAELKFRALCQCHDINSKTTFTLITLFFTLVMFLSFWHSKIVICGIITGRQG
jgi:hypothetical protein